MTEYEEDCKKLRECIEWFSAKYLVKDMTVRSTFMIHSDIAKRIVDRKNHHLIETSIDINNIIV